MDRISRSFRLVRQSYRILMQDSELMFLPFIAGLITLAAGFGIVYAFGVFQQSADEIQAEEIVPLFLFCVLAYGIGIFFQAAVVAGATERLRGGDPTMRSAIAAAWRRVGTIAIWALIAATIGVILDAIHERAGWLGKMSPASSDGRGRSRPSSSFLFSFSSSIPSAIRSTAPTPSSRRLGVRP